MSININWPKSIPESAYEEVMELFKKDSILSEKKKRLITIIESWDWSIYSRDRITEIIANLNINWTTINSISTENNSFKEKLTNLGSLEEKIAYVISLCFTKLPVEENQPLTYINPTTIIQLADKYINKIEEELNKWVNYDQKFIIRHAAFNRFNPKLTEEEKKLIDNTIVGLQEIIKEDWLNYSLHLWKETDAQKIMKIWEIFRLLYNAKVSDWNKTKLEELKKGFKTIEDLLVPLKELDKAYANLSAALNSMYTINRDTRVWWLMTSIRSNLGFNPGQRSLKVRAKSAMITSKDDIRRLRNALKIINNNPKFKIENYIKDLLDKGRVDINDELEKILIWENFEKALEETHLTEEIFIRCFLEHISQELVIQAKHNLETKKIEVFGNKKRDFDKDINSQKDIQRKKIIEIWQKVNITWEDIFVLTSYLRTNKHVFRLTNNPTNDQRIEADNDGIRKALEVAIFNICPNTCLADRTALRDSILTQNQHINELFHWDNNPFERKEALNWLWHSTLNYIRRVADHTSVLSKKYGQTASKVILWWVVAATWLSVWAATLVTLLWVGLGMKLWAKWLNVWWDKYHKWVNKERKWWRNFMFMPLKAAKIITCPLQKIWYWIDVWSTKVVDIIWKTRKRTNDLISWKIKDKKWVKELADEEVNNLFSLFALWLNWTVRLVMEWTSKLTRMSLDVIDTREKRLILEWIYSTRNSQNLRDFAEQIEIQSLIKEDVRLFEDDWYVETLETNSKESSSRPDDKVTWEWGKEKVPQTTPDESIKVEDGDKEVVEDKEDKSDVKTIKEVEWIIESLQSSIEHLGDSSDKVSQKDQLELLLKRLADNKQKIKMKADQFRVNKKLPTQERYNKDIKWDFKLLTKERTKIRAEIKKLWDFVKDELKQEIEDVNSKLEVLKERYKKIEYNIQMRINQIKLNMSNWNRRLNKKIKENLKKIIQEKNEIGTEIEKLENFIKSN